MTLTRESYITTVTGELELTFTKILKAKNVEAKARVASGYWL